MKTAVHPQTHDVVFLDTSTGAQFLSKSTKIPENAEKLKINGKEYSVIKVELTSDSHPFFTGKQKLIDSTGRVDKFRAKMEQAQKLQKAAAKKVKTVDEDEVEEVAKETAPKEKPAKKPAEKEEAAETAEETVKETPAEIPTEE